MARFRKQSARATAAHLQGYIHTIWSDANSFLNRYYTLKSGNDEGTIRPRDDARALRAVIAAFSQTTPEANK